MMDKEKQQSFDLACTSNASRFLGAAYSPQSVSPPNVVGPSLLIDIARMRQHPDDGVLPPKFLRLRFIEPLELRVLQLLVQPRVEVVTHIISNAQDGSRTRTP